MCVCVCVCVCVCGWVCLCLSMSVCVCVCPCLCLSVSLCMRKGRRCMPCSVAQLPMNELPLPFTGRQGRGAQTRGQRNGLSQRVQACLRLIAHSPTHARTHARTHTLMHSRTHQPTTAGGAGARAARPPIKFFAQSTGCDTEAKACSNRRRRP